MPAPCSGSRQHRTRGAPARSEPRLRVHRLGVTRPREQCDPACSRYSCVPRSAPRTLTRAELKCLTISLRWVCSCRVTMVFTTEIPILPPMLRNRLYKPLALPISSFRRNAIAVVESGTKMQPDPNPLMRIAQRNVHWPMLRLTRPNQRLATPNIPKPNAISQRLSIFAVR